MPNRRQFAKGAVALCIARPGSGQLLPTTRPDLAAIDHDRILRLAAEALGREAIPDVPDLAAANVLMPADGRYKEKASTLLTRFVAETRAAPELTAYEPLLERVPLAELAQAVPFLQLEGLLLGKCREWFAIYLTFLTEDRTALLARDAKDHHASSWLLQTTAAARLTRNEAVLAENRHRFRSPTLRNQIAADGLFPHELHAQNPLRDSLFNLDLLTGTCQILSSRFESVWNYELQDGPGIRAAVARHANFIRDLHTWPYPADGEHFKLLPGRRPALLFAARAYDQPEYEALWQSLKAYPDPTLRDRFPIRQPILWRPGI